LVRTAAHADEDNWTAAASAHHLDKERNHQ
jgi:hypothetical protein